MDLRLAGRHVLVTGASGGIGLACVAAFLAEGARVSMLARNQERLRAAADSLRAPDEVAVFGADLCDGAAAEAALDAVEAGFGPIDILVGTAGAARRTPPAELTPAAWRAAMDAKFFSTIHVADPLARRMAARGAGAIVNIVGMGGKVANPSHLAGGSANAALALGRPARPEEIADVAVFLASPRASYVNGAIVAMDGATTPMVV